MYQYVEDEDAVEDFDVIITFLSFRLQSGYPLIKVTFCTLTVLDSLLS